MENAFKVFSPTICLTHDCNLSCTYCYQKHDPSSMTEDVARRAIDGIFSCLPEGFDGINIQFIGGEALLKFNLIQYIYEYIAKLYPEQRVHFFATTNGTCLDALMKKWFSDRREKFSLGLSIDGNKDTHDHNRSNSFDLIDIDFFVKNWPNQGVKMTLSEYSLDKLADNIIFLHNIGFKEINGVNLAEGYFDWNNDKYIRMLIPQLKKLSDYYSDNIEVKFDQLFRKRIDLCEGKIKPRKWCGIGENTLFIDIDGSVYPCAYMTPMTFSKEELSNIRSVDFNDVQLFNDSECLETCYIYPICPACSGANYQQYGDFSHRNKTRCRINRLVALFVADMHANRIIKHPECYSDESILYNLIESIKRIKELYYDEFAEFLLECEQ